MTTRNLLNSFTIRLYVKNTFYTIEFTHISFFTNIYSIRRTKVCKCRCCNPEMALKNMKTIYSIVMLYIVSIQRIANQID